MSPIIHRVLWVRALRAFADGYVSLLLPVYLLSLGLTAFQVGVIATATLLGSAALSLGVGVVAHRAGYRTLLLAATGLMATTGFAFAAACDFWPLLVIAVVGTLNPSSGDVSVFLPLEQSLLAHTVEDSKRTSIFARYSLVGALVGALGALFAGAPDFAVKLLNVEPKTALQAMFVLYGAIGLAGAIIYRKLPQSHASEARAPAAPLEKSRRIVFTLAALFSLDAFGGGFVVQSMLALWLFERFDLSTAVAGTIFFWSGVFSAFS
ncbi:MAG TPA: MFS transporter, partial [Caldimonas sp.]|nr:MFS transporter [Caldimonas sp.]